jgi:pimeloyl-ACP methyl ester carboxylesterase
LSYGGLVAIDFALTYPHLVENLVLAGSGVSGYSIPGEDEIGVRSRSAFQRGGLHEVVEEWLRVPYMRPAMERADVAARIRTIAHQNDSTWLRSYRPFEPTGLQPAAIDRLSQLTPRTLVLVGERDIPAIRELADTLHARIHQSKLVTIPGAGHILSMEAPDEFNRNVLSFLAR